MIKLKSLFRRGHPSGSSKHSNSFTNQLQASASTCSLNSIGTSTPSTSPVATSLSKGSLQSTSAIYDSHDSLDSRGAVSEYVPPRTLSGTARGHSKSSNNVETIPVAVNLAASPIIGHNSSSSHSLFIDSNDIAMDSGKSHSTSYSTSSLQELSKDRDGIACKTIVLPQILSHPTASKTSGDADAECEVSRPNKRI